MAERAGLAWLRRLFFVAKLAAVLTLGVELLLVIVAILASFAPAGGYVGTNLSSDAQFFAVALSPLLAFTALNLLILAGLGLRFETGDLRGPYRRALIGALGLLGIAGLGLVLSLSFLGGGIIPH